MAQQEYVLLMDSNFICNMDLSKLAYDLTMSTVEVEGAHELKKDFENVVVGVIKEVLPHPNADKLRVCKVDIAADEIKDIVCGGSTNRIAAWAIGFRSWQKALLMALCTPNAELKKLQDENRLTELMVRQEEVKMYPLGDVWAQYCEECGVPQDRDLFAVVDAYEKEVLVNRK